MRQVLNQLQLKGHYQNFIVILAFSNQIESLSTLAKDLSLSLREDTSLDFKSLVTLNISYNLCSVINFFPLHHHQTLKLCNNFFFAFVDIGNLLM